MEKQLTIAIPSYNMEEFLDQCIGSMVTISEVGLQALEVICVNDGSKDRTSEIAHSYADRYPDTVRVIDKANGHYGSCVNAALKEATGRYFRTVDADDWIDSEALEILLRELAKIESDCVLTNFNINREGKIEKIEYNALRWGDEIDLTKEKIDMHYWLGMHMLTWKTDFLRRIGYRQTEGICYTDVQYSVLPLVQAKNLIALNIYLYQYRLGREGQSMDEMSLYRNRKHILKMLLDLNFELSQGTFLNYNSSEIINRFYKYAINTMMIEYLWNKSPLKMIRWNSDHSYKKWRMKNLRCFNLLKIIRYGE